MAKTVHTVFASPVATLQRLHSNPRTSPNPPPRFVDTVQTIFPINRKSPSQLGTLHTIHFSLLPILLGHFSRPLSKGLDCSAMCLGMALDVSTLASFSSTAGSLGSSAIVKVSGQDGAPFRRIRSGSQRGSQHCSPQTGFPKQVSQQQGSQQQSSQQQGSQNSVAKISSQRGSVSGYFFVKYLLVSQGTFVFFCFVLNELYVFVFFCVFCVCVCSNVLFASFEFVDIQFCLEISTSEHFSLEISIPDHFSLEISTSDHFLPEICRCISTFSSLFYWNLLFRFSFLLNPYFFFTFLLKPHIACLSATSESSCQCV